MTTALFAEFSSVTGEQWQDAVLKSLPSETIDSLIANTYEGIDIHPLPQADDLAAIAHHRSLPGQFPFVRGRAAAGYRARPWLIAADIDISDPRDFNLALRAALAGGQTAITIHDSLRLNEPADIRLALADIDLEHFPLFIQSEARAPDIYALLCKALDNETLARLTGCIGYDPLNNLARTGAIGDDAFEGLAAHVKSVSRHSPKIDSVSVGTAVYHDAGANAAQELALAIATGVAYLRELAAREFAIETVAPKLQFFLNIGENFFLEIAKFRAVRLLWAQVMQAFNRPNLARHTVVYARAGARNKSVLGAHVNLLRLTTEALSAAIGGVDSIQLPPFDEARGNSGDASRRLSRNLQLILQEELRLVELIDPAGGAWHVEKLTDQLARAAWTRFQALEAAGGPLASLRAGTIQAEIAAVASQRQRDMASGEAVLVGVNRYVDAAQEMPDRARVKIDEGAASTKDATSAAPIAAQRLAEPFEARRLDTGSGS